MRECVIVCEVDIVFIMQVCCLFIVALKFVFRGRDWHFCGIVIFLVLFNCELSQWANDAELMDPLICLSCSERHPKALVGHKRYFPQTRSEMKFNKWIHSGEFIPDNKEQMKYQISNMFVSSYSQKGSPR